MMTQMPSLKPSPGQVALAEQLARGEASVGDEVRRLSVDRYRDEDRHRRELDLIFRRRPLPLVPSALLPDKDMAVTHDEYGQALIITRDEEGQVHVMANSCAHRGTRLINDKRPVRARKMVCPYHAWTYRADGSLAGLPRQDAFPGLCKEDHGLVRYPAAECGGIIWVGFSDDVDFSGLAALCEDFDALGLGHKRLYKRRIHKVKSNWKMVMDAFLESYHVKRLHQATIAEFFADGIVAADRLGEHQRFAVGRTQYAAKVDTANWQQVREAMTFSYQMFPNGVLIVSPHYTNLMVVMPDPEKVNRCKVEDFMLVPAWLDPGEYGPSWEKSWRLLDGGTFGEEDFGAAALCQSGVDTGVHDEVLIGTLEHGITTFHDHLDAMLDGQAAE